MQLDQALVVTAEVVRILDQLGVEHLVGGSVASSLYGTPRSTADVDIVARLEERHIDRLVSALEGRYYVEPSMIREALAAHGAFNVIHLGTMFKVDIFVAKGDSHGREQFERRRPMDIAGDQIMLASAEDIVLHKLLWYQMGDGVSERQWNDVLGVLRVSRDDLDHVYMNAMAATIGVSELLDRAVNEAAC